MKTLVTKKNILIFSGIIMLVALLATEEFRFCYLIGFKKCPIPLNDSGEALLYPFFVILFFSLLTYRLKEEVFQAWWNFARWFVPIIMFFQFIFMNSSGGGGIGNSDFAIFFTSLFYIAFILISLIKIVRAYKRTKGN